VAASSSQPRGGGECEHPQMGEIPHRSKLKEGERTRNEQPATHFDYWPQRQRFAENRGTEVETYAIVPASVLKVGCRRN
jgi:hypothetical protein